DGTKVRSTSVDGRLRVDATSSAGRRAPIGTNVLGIIVKSFPPRSVLLVGRAPHAPGCLPSPHSPTPMRHVLPLRPSLAQPVFALPPQTLQAPRAMARPPAPPASQT